MKKNSVKNLSKTEKVKLVKKKYNIKNIKPINIENITYRHKLYLLAIFRVLTDENFDKILQLNSQNITKVLSPSKDMDINILDCLYTSDLICVDPISDIDSFQFDNKDCKGFNVKEVSWLVNISSDNDERLQLNVCFRLIYNDLTEFFPTSIEERNQIYYFIMNLALNEVENYLQFKSIELSYNYKVGSKTSMYIYQLLRYLSVTEIYNIVDRSVDEDYLYNSRLDIKPKDYGNTIAARLLEGGELAKRDETSLIKLPRNENLERSELSKIFYELIHHGLDEGFSECPLDYWNSSLKQCYYADSE
jgi:hypothetical protein